MKPYGVPRILDIEFPDVVDIQRFGMQSHIGKLPNDQHSYTRNAKARHATRRIFKHIERQQTRHLIKKEVDLFCRCTIIGTSED